MVNTVCVLTNFRAGSTAFTLLKSKEYDLPYMGELFSHERPWAYGGHLAFWQELEMGRDDPDNPLIPTFVQGRPFREDYIKALKIGEQTCFKLMPDHVIEPWRRKPWPHGEVDLEIVKSVDKVILLYRRDWKAQVLSWVALRTNGEFGRNGLRHSRKSGNPRLVDFHWNMHVAEDYYDEAVVRELNVDPESQYVENLAGQLKLNYLRMAELHKQLDNVEVVCMEDFFATQPYKKYNHVFDWKQGEPVVEDFDVEGLFT